MFHGYAATAVGEKLKPFTFDPGPLRDHEVEVRVTHCGICHSDLSMIHNEWAISTYPVVPGHEAVGVVESVGSRVTSVKPGDRVGVGWWSNSCGTCEWCRGGERNLCPQAEGTIVGRHGGFADRVRCDATFAIRIPDAMGSSGAAPLLCAGTTVFQPFEEYEIRPTSRVAVLGIGGLGHLALQFADKWGCEVTAFTTSLDKSEELRRLGADHVASSRDEAGFAKLAGSFDFIISTVAVDLPWAKYLAMLRPKGTLCTVGIPTGPVGFTANDVINGDKRFVGASGGNPLQMERMLRFCVQHGITAQVQEFAMTQVNEALEKLRRNEARYRYVLVV